MVVKREVITLIFFRLLGLQDSVSIFRKLALSIKELLSGKREPFVIRRSSVKTASPDNLTTAKNKAS